MKKYILLTILLATTISISFAQNMNYAWAKKIGSTGNDGGNANVIDDQGNVYTTGYFQGTVDFDPGSGITSLTASAYTDIFVTKFDATGKFLWATSFAGSGGGNVGLSIAFDQSHNVYVTGLTNSGGGVNAIPIAKITKTGSLLWSYGIGGVSATGNGTSIVFDDSDNIYLSGYFTGTMDFDPGIGVHNLTSLGGNDMFIVKMTSSAKFIWAKSIGNTLNTLCMDIALDDSSNIYATGYFNDTTDFDPGSDSFYLQTWGGNDVFILKLDSSGNFKWAKQLGGTITSNGLSIEVDDSGNVYSSGEFSGTVDFDPGNGVDTLNAGYLDLYISKLTRDGEFIWAKQLVVSSGEYGVYLDLDGYSNVYATGGYWGVMDADPDTTNTYDLTSSGNYDIFILKFDSSGNFKWAKSLGGDLADRGSSIAVDILGENVYTTGRFKDSLDFDPGSGTTYLKSGGDNDIFMQKIECRNFSTITVSECNSYTSPSGLYTWYSTRLYFDTIANVSGCDSIITIKLTIKSTTGSITTSACSNYLSPSGKYTWDTTGIYTDTIPNSASCDSIITVNLTIKSTSSTISKIACDSYTSPSGIYTWTATGTYMDTIPNAASCDSVITVNLIINNTSSSTVSVGACNSYTSPSTRYVWNTSGMYMDTIPNAAGCDSVITVNLSINHNSSSFSATSCNTYKSPSQRYTWTSTGAYMDTIPNAKGCDSVMTINLTIKQSNSSTISPVGCQSYTSPSGKYIWTTSGNFKDTIANAAGCDSIINIQLAITTVDTSVKQVGFTLSANASGATYQWLDCKNSYSVIAGATNQSFTPTANGDYAVAVTKNSCSDTSSCRSFKLSGIADNSFEQSFTLYPNPTQGKFVIDLGSNTTPVSIIVTDLAGRTLNTLQSQGRKLLEVELNQPAGIYFVTVSSLQGKTVMKVVKE